MNNQQPKPIPWWAYFVMIGIFLVPAGYGFVGKLYEFFHMYRSDSEGVFAITPMANYLFASLGFLCLMFWAAYQGMFHDIEQPKQDMLQNEAELDRQELLHLNKPHKG
ncbi:MAG: hypothetical protein KDA68_19060 [Planctomycetaceae bacterium]|nr:hypothetical protein [Planctomycetaceae bacterium]MCA9098785.1 hypothetical protein [Planctomycetaceae bacterium]